MSMIVMLVIFIALVVIVSKKNMFEPNMIYAGSVSLDEIRKLDFDDSINITIVSRDGVSERLISNSKRKD